MFGAWWDVIEFVKIKTLINFVMQGCSEEEFKVFMSERFNKSLHSNACAPTVFDDTATSNLLSMIRKYHNNENHVYTMVKFYVYHTYMVLFHKINKEDEYRILNYKLRKLEDPEAVY
jgi:hypothetical protein